MGHSVVVMRSPCSGDGSRCVVVMQLPRVEYQEHGTPHPAGNEEGRFWSIVGSSDYARRL